ncbi:MAG: sulfatase-like hydrolase/transferase [Gammaproteobacteria bacterium]|nr:sulfatase-like hydrolase/transferase [Gammaproteobacteria bacterium]
MNPQDHARRLGRLFTLAYGLLLLIGAGFLRFASLEGQASTLFALIVLATYSALYLLPAWALTRVVRALERGRRRLFSTASALLALGVSLVLLVTDQTIFGMFQFHLNGFVWNLLTTPGGIESMGGDRATELTVALMMAGLMLLPLILWRLSRAGTRLARLLDRHWHARRCRQALLLLLVLSLGERAAYGFSHLQAYSPILDTAQVFPMYAPTTFKSAAARFGISPKRGTELRLSDSASLNYPLTPLKAETPARPLNIVWLVSESLRADMLTPEIMPNLWRFSEGARRYTQHVSGGNGTRMGLFTLFYGLYGNYWFPMLQNRRSPVLMDRVQELGYELVLQTSSKFSYPEFDQTLFARVPKSQMHEETEGTNWQRDRNNVARLLAHLDRREPAKPLFFFQFFESPHARYYFPDESAIRQPYLEDLNYATMDVQRDIELIRARYINAVHHLDQQLGRVFEGLEARGLLDSTIVLVTGDHGEEFLEKGHWGHNSQFTNEQTRVPLVLHVPGQAPAVIDSLSSHLDIAATLMPLLGVQSPAEDYSLGQSLLTGPERTHTVLADWNRIAYQDARYKLVFPLKSGTHTPNAVTDPNDRPVADPGAMQARYQGEMMQVLKELTRFLSKR